jgi:FtsH-binding integral membrane protein
VRPAALIAVATASVFLVVAWIEMPWVSGDTPFVLDGSNAFLNCLHNHDYSACGYTGKLNYWGLMTSVGDWPLLQHVPDLLSIGLGADGHAARTRILELLSVAAVVGAVALAWIALNRSGQRAWFWAFMAVVLSSPLVWYARTTAGEALATGLLVAFVAATVIPAHPALVGLAAIGAAWTKETSYPFLVALGIVGLVLARRRTGTSIRPPLIWGAAGLALGILAASLFNVVRYGKVVSPNFFESELHTPGVARKLEYAVGVLVSPSGGMFVFWPAASVLVLVACIVALRGRADPRPALVILAVILGLTLGFASWWTPFGWSAIGPRLALPWGLPLVLLALVAYGGAMRPFAVRLLVSPWSVLAIFAVVLAFSLANIGTMWRPNATGAFFQQQQPPCDAPWRGGVEKWNRCQHEQMWFDRPMPLYGLHGVKSPGGAVTTLFIAAALLGCLVLLRAELAAAPGKGPNSGSKDADPVSALAPVFDDL